MCIQSSPTGYVHRLCVFRVSGEDVCSPDLRACKSAITGDISPACWAEGRPLGSLSLSLSFSFSSLSTVERRTDTHLVPHWEDSKEQSSSKWNAERAQRRAGGPILSPSTFRKMLIAEAGIKTFFKLWPTKLNDPCTSNIWLYYVNITWLQLEETLVLS